MSGPDLLDEPEPPEPKPRRRRLRWLVAAGLLLVGVIAGVLFFLNDPSEQELREAIAEADRIDPGWRFEDLDARREVIPDEENAALCALAARRLMPPGRWPPLALLPGGRPTPDRVGETIAYLPPPVQLPEAVAREINAQLARVEPALVEALKLKTLSQGRCPVAWGESTAGIKIDWEPFNDVRSMLIREAMVRAQEGRSGEALATGRAILVVGRSVGDEPGMDPVYTRLNSQRDAIRSIERTLAQGTPAPDELRATQNLLEDEAVRPLLLIALRGDRAATLRAVDAGYLPPDNASGRGRMSRLVGRVGAARRGRSALAGLLRKETECVEIAKLPIEEQRQPFDQVMATGPRDGSDLIGHNVWWMTASAEDFCRFQALLRCAITGLALERYRDETGRWPERLDDLSPAHLKAVPLDPFDGRPLRYKRLADGVVVYSVTPGDQKRFGRTHWVREGGFRLWDVDKRRQPPAEVLPQPVSPK